MRFTLVATFVLVAVVSDQSIADLRPCIKTRIASAAATANCDPEYAQFYLLVSGEAAD